MCEPASRFDRKKKGKKEKQTILWSTIEREEGKQ